MKQIKIILLLVLVFSLVVGSLTSCDVLEKLGINIPGSGDNNPSDDEGGDDVIDPANCGHYVTTVKNQKAASCKEEGYTGDKVCYACGTLITAGKAIPQTADHKFKDGTCTVCGVVKIDESETVIAEWKAQYQTITVSEALTLCEQFVEAPSEARYYIVATVKSVDNASFGQLTIEDETGEMMVYGTNSSDGSLKYDQMDVELKAGDLILIYGTLQNYNGNTKEVQNAWLIDHYAKEVVPPSIDVEPGSTITIEKALEIAGYVGEDVRFYITATVQSIKNPAYGEMYIEDETGEIYVYGCYNEDGSIGYAAMEDKPYKGDTVTLYVVINVYNGTPQIKNARIISFTHNEIEFNENDYAELTIDAAREAADGTLVKVNGVVARITYASGMVPSGFYLVDGTNSIYVYDGNTASRVAIGNTVTVYGEKEHWILEKEQESAAKHGYNGCNQITNVINFESDNGTTDFDKSWITESTVKEILNTPVTTDITTTIYKVNALISRSEGASFINYYINDLDGVTGSYTYTQANGGDFAWLDQFDGKICTVYLSVLNAKSSPNDCIWRFIPVAVEYEGYTLDSKDVPDFVFEYHVKDNFNSNYTADPELTFTNVVSSDLLGFEGVTITYTSSNEEIAKFTVTDEGVLFNLLAYGDVTVTVTITYGDYVGNYNINLTYTEPVQYDFITVEQAIVAEEDSTIIVKGIVGPSLVNKVGFYLMGENALIAVITDSDTMATLSIGNEIIITGKRETYSNGAATHFGQSSIVDAVVLVNNLGNHEFNDDYFIEADTIQDLPVKNITVDHTTEVYVIELKFEFYDGGRYTSLTVTDKNGTALKLYMSGANQYSWMSEYYGDYITVEVAPCNWNNKTDEYRGCVLAIVLEDGSKIYNTLNFNN